MRATETYRPHIAFRPSRRHHLDTIRAQPPWTPEGPALATLHFRLRGSGRSSRPGRSGGLESFPWRHLPSIAHWVGVDVRGREPKRGLGWGDLLKRVATFLGGPARGDVVEVVHKLDSRSASSLNELDAHSVTATRAAVALPCLRVCFAVQRPTSADSLWPTRPPAVGACAPCARRGDGRAQFGLARGRRRPGNCRYASRDPDSPAT